MAVRFFQKRAPECFISGQYSDAELSGEWIRNNGEIVTKNYSLVRVSQHAMNNVVVSAQSL
jgi:hypothetical protein